MHTLLPHSRCRAFRFPHCWAFGGLFLLLALAAPTQAAKTYYVSPKGSDKNPGTSSKPFKTIQHGIDAGSDGDTVTLQDGTYTGPGDVDLDFGGTNLTVNSVNGAGKAIIDCGGSSSASHRAFYFHTNETAAVVSGVTITNGYAKNGGGIYIYSGIAVTVSNSVLMASIADGYYGGGVCNSGGTLTLTGCTLSGNTAYGGGIFNSGTATVTDCAFSKNTGDYGGCVYNNGGTMLFAHCTFTENVAGYAGGMLQNFGMTTLTDCTLTKNTASYFGGGAIINGDSVGHFRNSAIVVTSCTFNENRGIDGGAVLSYEGTATLTGCTFTGNEANGDGGGIYNESAASLSGCVFIGNRATGGGRGGAFADLADSSSDVTATNCVFSGNEATRADGGAVYNGNVKGVSDTSHPLTLRFCTFAGNNSGGDTTQGGAVENDGTLNVIDSILYGDTAFGSAEIGTGPTVNNVTPLTTVTHTDIQGGFTGTGNFNVKPLFVRVPDPTADTPDYGDLHLSPSSPCIGKGITISGVTTDRDGLTRKNPPTLGAYEVLPRITTLSPASATVGSPAFTLTVVGIDFVSTSLVKWNGTALSTTYVSSTKLAASVPASLIASVGTAKVTVTTPGVATSGSKTFTINPKATVKSLTLSPTTVTGGASCTGTITLTAPAPAGGLAITQKSSDTTAATLAGTLNIPAGATSAKFKITTYAVTRTKTVTITSSVNGVSKTATLTVTP